MKGEENELKTSMMTSSLLGVNTKPFLIIFLNMNSLVIMDVELFSEVTRHTVTSVVISIIFRYVINIVKNETIKIVELESFNKTDVQ